MTKPETLTRLQKRAGPGKDNRQAAAELFARTAGLRGEAQASQRPAATPK